MAYNNMFSIPVSKKRQTSMRRKFIVFSSVLFLLIFIVGSAIYIILMNQILNKNAGRELSRIVEIERLKLEASMNGEIAIVLRLADSPLLHQYFLNPENEIIKQFALVEIDGYRKAFSSNSVFWVNDIDKKFYLNDSYVYTLDIESPDNYWYSLTLNNTERYNFNINYNPDLNVTNLWINAPVFDDRHKPIGILGTSINLSNFIHTIYKNYWNEAELYLFNAMGEITGASDVSLVENKINITKALEQTGSDIFAYAKGLKTKEIKYFQTKRQIIAVGLIQTLDWYITVIRHFNVGDSLQTGMTVLFAVIMAVIFLIFLIFNLFIIGMLEPLNRMVKTIIQTLSDWDLKHHEGDYNNDEIGTLGEFFHLTIIDQLTGIYNRRYLDGTLKKLIKSHSRTGGSISVLMIDVDYFKKFNDVYGHDAGDDCLKKVATALSQCVIREDDFVARYGGEEFAVVLPNTDENGVRVVAEKMLEKVRECNIRHEKSEVADYVTISVGGTTGVVNHLQHGSDYIKAADSALYESKKSGRNRYTFMNF